MLKSTSNNDLLCETFKLNHQELSREEMYRAMSEAETLRKEENVFDVCDPTVMTVLRKFESRHKEGMRVYGTTMASNTAPLEFWINSAMEEAMDLTLYLQRTLEELNKGKVSE
jgi:hypothetical protein